MKSNFLPVVAKRRTIYSISKESVISDSEIQEIIEYAIKHAPSAFNSQSSRVLLLKGAEHKALWDIVLEALKTNVSENAFTSSKEKIDTCFACGYGTVVFFEEQETVKKLQDQFATYASYFPQWSEHHSGLLQFIIWTALEEAGLGASLQHYSNLIEDKVKAHWKLPQSWKLIAQMPFGKPVAAPGEKEFMPMEQRLRVLP